MVRRRQVQNPSVRERLHKHDDHHLFLWRQHKRQLHTSGQVLHWQVRRCRPAWVPATKVVGCVEVSKWRYGHESRVTASGWPGGIDAGLLAVFHSSGPGCDPARIGSDRHGLQHRLDQSPFRWSQDSLCITPWFAVAVWLVLAVLLGMRPVHQRDRLEHEARSPAALNRRRRHRRTRHPVGDRGLRHGRRGGSSHRLECFGR